MTWSLVLARTMSLFLWITPSFLGKPWYYVITGKYLFLIDCHHNQVDVGKNGFFNTHLLQKSSKTLIVGCLKKTNELWFFIKRNAFHHKTPGIWWTFGASECFQVHICGMPRRLSGLDVNPKNAGYRRNPSGYGNAWGTWKGHRWDAAIPWCDDCGAEIFLISRNIMITITWLGSNMFFEKKCKRFRSGVFFSFSCISLMFVGCFYMNLAISRFNSPWPWAAFDGATALDHWTTSSHVQEVHPSHVAKHHWIWILLMFFFGL